MEKTLIKNLFSKIKNLFRKKNDAAIPFAEHSKKAVKKYEQKKPPQKPVSDKKNNFKPRQKYPKKEITPVKNATAPPKKEVPPRKKQKPWNINQFSVPEVEGKLRFHDLNLPSSIMHGIADLKFQYCTPVQAGILPEALKGRDAIGKAQTGTGKSAAFILTILSHMIRKPIKGGPPKGQPRALILAPTRELALQIEKDALKLSKYTPFKIISIYGGTGYEKQMNALKDRAFDIVVATPGRLIDFKNKKLIRLDSVQILVLDEADRMLDMGFIPDVRKIIYSTPHKDKRQTFFYSATLSPEVERLADQWTTNPCRIEIEPDQVASDTVKQVVYIVTSHEKFALLYNMIVSNKLERVLIFTNRKDQARGLAEKLNRHDISSTLLTGDVQQNKRIRALEDFRAGKFRALVATDVAARGIHIDDISHVINYNLPQDPENYVHRIGRTGRAGTSGISVSYACEDDSFHIPDIEAFLGNELVCEHPDDSLFALPPAPKKKPAGPKPDKPANQSKRRPYNQRNNYKGRKPGYSKNNSSGGKQSQGKPNYKTPSNKSK